MNYNYRYRLKPSESQCETLDYHRDTCRQLYNHALYRLNQIPESAGTVLQRVRSIRDELPALKDWWETLTDIYSKVLQPTVMRIAHNVNSLGKLKEQGYSVGKLRWKSLRDFRSFTYNQSGFELDKKGGQTVVSLSKLGDIPIYIHRDMPTDALIKEVTLKKEMTGEWFAIFGIEMDTSPPEKPPLDELAPEQMVGIDVGILKYVHDTAGTAVASLDLTEERERLEREQRSLSRKEYGSNNWERQRRRVAACHLTIKRKRRDFLHKLSAYYARAYDLVAVEDLNVKGMLESPKNSRNTAAAAWGTFTRILEDKCEREGTHFVDVDPKDTTKACANCGVKTHKPLWVREHSCPACGYEEDRDGNAAINILSKGLNKLGVGHSEATPVETALPVDTVVSANRVIETGSPCLKESRSDE
jgi:putative transposase